MSKHKDLDWVPFPGHWPGQSDEGRFYGSAMYEGLHLEILEMPAGVFGWSFYDDDSYDLDVAVARNNDDPFDSFDDALADLLDYCDGYLEMAV